MAAHRLVAVGLFLTAFSDVAPRCGECGGRRSQPEVSIHDAWDECGWHGPRYKLECRPPAVCMQFEASYTTHDGGMTTAHLCSAKCATDADCAKLGAGFRCAGTGRDAFEAADAGLACIKTD